MVQQVAVLAVITQQEAFLAVMVQAQVLARQVGVMTQ